MAFNEAILTDERPNVFELLAEEQLREALRPALLYLTKVTHSLYSAEPAGDSTLAPLASLLYAFAGAGPFKTRAVLLRAVEIT